MCISGCEASRICCAIAFHGLVIERGPSRTHSPLKPDLTMSKRSKEYEFDRHEGRNANKLRESYEFKRLRYGKPFHRGGDRNVFLLRRRADRENTRFLRRQLSDVAEDIRLQASAVSLTAC